MVKVREVLVVEGKYDKIRLSSLVDALIVETNGFGIFRDAEQMALLRRLAAERGLIVLTDSDSAGFVIRDHLSGSIPAAQIKHAYVPEVVGKERRKAQPSKEGLLGVEGLNSEVLLAALRRTGATLEEDGETAAPAGDAAVTKAQFYADGFTGCPDSAQRRRRLLVQLGLPQKLSANRLLAVINATMTAEEYRRAVEEIDKNA